MASRLITPVLEERLKSYPLYSQDGNRRTKQGQSRACLSYALQGGGRRSQRQGCRLCGNILHRTRPLVRT